MKKKIIAILVNGELMFMSIVVLVPVVWIILSAFQSGNALGNLWRKNRWSTDSSTVIF